MPNALSEIEKISDKLTLRDDDVQALSGYVEELKQDKALAELLPTLSAYRDTHTENGLRKLCVDTADFIKALYASTQTDAERKIVRAMIGKLNNL